MTASSKRNFQSTNVPNDEQFPRPHDNCYWIIPGRFLAGEYPGAYRADATRQRLQGYLAAGITHFIDLTHPNDGLAPYDVILAEVAARFSMNATYQRIPVYDMSTPPHTQMVEILDAIDAALAAGAGVYVHCWGGIGRTGTAVGCHLVRHGLDGDGALAQLARWWQGVEKSAHNPRSPETDAQVAMIRGWVE